MDTFYKNKFTTSPGLPGYGPSGKDGLPGLNGLSFYIANYDGGDDFTIIANRIINNQTLLDSNATYLPGYPTRVYQNNDIFADRKGKLYKIDFGDSNKYIPLRCTSSNVSPQCNLGFLNLFAEGPTQSEAPYFMRYSNEFTEDKVLIDTVYSLGSENYVDNEFLYDNSTIQYAELFLVDQSIANLAENNYRLYNIWISGKTTITNNDALALVKDNNWHLGNKSGNIIRNINLELDFQTTTISNDASILNNSFSNNLETNNIIISNDGSVATFTIQREVSIGPATNNTIYKVNANIPLIINKNLTKTKVPLEYNNSLAHALSKGDINLDRLFEAIFEYDPNSFTVVKNGTSIDIHWDKKDFFNITNYSELDNYIMNLYIIKEKDSNNSYLDLKNKATVISKLGNSDSLTISNLESGKTYRVYIEFQYRGWIINSKSKTVNI